MSKLLVVAMAGLTVSACCGPLPDLPEVAFGPDGVASVNGKPDGTGRKAMSLEEAVAELRSFHEAIVGEVTEGLCAEEVAASFEVMTVRSKGGLSQAGAHAIEFPERQGAGCYGGEHGDRDLQEPGMPAGRS